MQHFLSSYPILELFYHHRFKCPLSLKEIIRKNLQKRSRFVKNLHWNVILRNRLAVIVYYTVFHYFSTKTTDLHNIDRYHRYYFSRIYPFLDSPYIKLKEDVCIYNVYKYTWHPKRPKPDRFFGRWSYYE